MITVKHCTAEDIPDIYRLMKGLAEFEKMSDALTIDEKGLELLMTEEKAFEALLAYKDGKAVGLALYYFYMLSTFSGRRVLYLEDIFVDEEYRKKGTGRLLMQELINEARARGCIKMEWKCLKWNENAVRFYEKLGAEVSPDWLTFTLKEDKF